MRIGAESRNKVIAASVLGGLALLLVARVLISTSAPAPVAPVAVVPTSTGFALAKKPAGKTKASAKRVGPPHSIDPELRYDWLKGSEEKKYSGEGRNIFSAQAPIPKPIENGVTDARKAAEASGPPPPPPPPPINLKFFGFASKPGEPKKIFLSQGEDIFIASEGDIVNRRYKVTRISPASVEIEDEMNNHRQSIPLTIG
jgi:hypothetical protein